MKTTRRIILLFMILSGFIFIGNANALKFTGEAWLAQHYTSDGPTDEYYLIIEKSDVARAKLRGFKLEPSGVEREFSQLTGLADNQGVSWWEVNLDDSRFYKKFSRKAERRFKRLIRRGRLQEDTDKQAWVDAWVDRKLGKRKFKLIFWDDRGKRYIARIDFATFLNDEPVDGPDNEIPGAGPAPVPEPATLLLLGSGLLGLAGMGRKKLFKKK